MTDTQADAGGDQLVKQPEVEPKNESDAASAEVKAEESEKKEAAAASEAAEDNQEPTGGASVEPAEGKQEPTSAEPAEDKQESTGGAAPEPAAAAAAAADSKEAYDPTDDPVDVTQVEPSLDETAPSPDASMVAVSPSTSSDSAAKNTNENAAGPETVVAPADSFICSKRDGAVKLRMGKEGLQAAAPITVPGLFMRTAKNYPKQPALKYKEDGKGKWITLTYSEYLDTVRAAAKSFIKLGVEPCMSVGILGFNSPEWFYANLGAIFCGGYGVGIYATNSPEAVQYVAHHAQARVIVVENDAQLQKVLKVEDQLPHLKYIVQYHGTPSVKKDNLYSWKEFMSIGEGVSHEELDNRIKAQAVNTCCTLIYTSGTTGNPKGVMLSHDNLTWTASTIVYSSNYRMASETIISYLPLSHIAAQMLDIYSPIYAAGTVYFAQPDALRGSLAQTLSEVQPTAFFGVPRVWEKIEAKLKSIQSANTGLKKKLGSWATGVMLRGNTSLQDGGSTPFGWTLAGMLVKKARVGLGFTNCRLIYSGAAPIARETVEFFASLNIPVCEVYGLSETSGPETSNFWNEGLKMWKFGSAGKTMKGCETYIGEPLQKGEDDGEICMCSRNVFMGYMDEEEKTKECFDEEFRFHSGDVGRKNKDGFLFITGRIKELLITAGGENVAPVPIEDLVKAECDAISNCMLVGDRLKFLSLLVCLKTEVDPDTTEPKPEFLQVTLDWLASIGSSAKKMEDVLDGKDEAVQKALTAIIEKVNAKSESRAKRIAKFLILPKDFSLFGGELGPTLKLKRKVVMAQYEQEIAKLYEE